MPYRLIEDSGYHLGMIRESPAWRLPAGAVYDASNILFDTPGLARQRGGTTALVSGSQTARPTILGFCHSDDATVVEELYGYNGKNGDVVLINKSTGAFTTLLATAITGTAGRPVRHFGFLFFPFVGTLRGGITVCGTTSATTFTSATAVVLTAGAQQLTLGGADTTTNIKVGAFVNAAGAATTYYGRVVSVDSSTKLTVWPTPSVTFTTGAASFLTSAVAATHGGSCATSFQNRLLWGNANDISSTSTGLVVDRRVYYSLLPTETYNTGSMTYTGATFAVINSFPPLNYFEVPGADPIIAMEPINDGELVILTSTGVVILQGQLATQTESSAPGITFDIYPLPTPAGCLSDLSVQKTPIGIMWASSEGIFAYWPPIRRSAAHTGLRELTEGTIHTYWRDLTLGSGFAIHGSTYVRNHYVLSGTSGGSTFVLGYNLGTNAWTTFSDDLDVFYGLPRPTIPQQNFALRWWDQSGSAPSFTNGQTIRTESAFNLDVAGQTKLDADGTAVAFTLTSRAMTDDMQSERFARRIAVRYQAEMAGTSVTIAAGARVDPGLTGGTPITGVGSLSNTAVLSISAATNATPIVITTSTTHGLQSGDQVDVHGATPNTAANGRFRIAVLSGTTFQLLSTTGNGATAAAGTVMKVTEQEFDASGMDIGQATFVKVASSGTVNRFELHGLRVGVLEIIRGMGH